MTTRFRRPMLVLGAIILVMQAVFMPVGMVYAESSFDDIDTGTKNSVNHTIEEDITQEGMEPPTQDDIDQDSVGIPSIQTDDSKQVMDTIQSMTEESISNEISSNDEIDNQIRFSIDVGDYIEVKPKEEFKINVHVNQVIDSFRIIIPKGTTFVVEDELDRTNINQYENGSELWKITIKEKTDHLPISFNVVESGQIAVEDQDGEKNAAFLHVDSVGDTKISYYSDQRFVLQAFTWATFVASWNNSFVTEIQVMAEIPTGVETYLITRTTNIHIRGPRSSMLIVNGNGSMFQWNQNVKVTVTSLVLQNFRVTGGDLDLYNSGIHLTGASTLGNVVVDGIITSSNPNLVYSIRTTSNLAINSLVFNGLTLLLETTGPTMNIASLQINSAFYSIRNTSNRAVINSQRVNINRTGLMTWDLDNMTLIGSRAWRNLTAEFNNTNIINSLDPLFNNDTFRLDNSRWIRSLGSGSDGVQEPPTPQGIVKVYYLDEKDNELIENETLEGPIGEPYTTEKKEIDGWEILELPSNAEGLFSLDQITVKYVYKEISNNEPVLPVDPLNPEVEVDPENKPELPDDQGQLSIDFVSSFNFGSQAISVHNQTYNAQPQRLMNEDGTVNETEERPNYVQISDRRPENDRNGWQLAVTQKEQFKNSKGHTLFGASLGFFNQQLIMANGNKEPSLQATTPLFLVPGNKRTLIRAEADEGKGTWIYRFGNAETAGESVVLNIPKGSNPEATNYSAIFTWELSAVPNN